MPVPTNQARPPVAHHPGQSWSSQAQLREVLLRLDTDLDIHSPTAQAALILLAGLRMEHNVVKLANFAGVSCDFAARCARRLVDNGIWRSNQTLCSWRLGTGDMSAFWADVAVAEGRLCRRLDETGRPEWAPGGHWWKSFDLVRASEAERLEQSVLYYSPPAPASQSPGAPHLDVEDGMEPAPGDLTPEKSVNSPEKEPAADRGEFTLFETGPAHSAADEPDDDSGEDESSFLTGDEQVDVGTAAPDLFPGAVWL